MKTIPNEYGHNLWRRKKNREDICDLWRTKKVTNKDFSDINQVMKLTHHDWELESQCFSIRRKNITAIWSTVHKKIETCFAFAQSALAWELKNLVWKFCFLMSDSLRERESLVVVALRREECYSRPFVETSTKISRYLHVPYHPDNPPSSKLQQLFRECISHPDGAPPLCELDNLEHNKIQVDGMMICYHRHLNLGNVLSYRKIDQRKGPKVSDLLKAGRGDE